MDHIAEALLPPEEPCRCVLTTKEPVDAKHGVPLQGLPAYRCWTGDLARQEQHLQLSDLLLAVRLTLLLAVTLALDALQNSI